MGQSDLNFFWEQLLLFKRFVPTRIVSLVNKDIRLSVIC